MAPEEAGLTLLVAIVAADPVRRLGLAALVTRAGIKFLNRMRVLMSCSPKMSLFAVTVRRSWRLGRPMQAQWHPVLPHREDRGPRSAVIHKLADAARTAT
jgi:hypothetical protein